MSVQELSEEAFYGSILGEGMPGVETIVLHQTTRVDTVSPPTIWCKRTNPHASYERNSEIENDERYVFLRFGKNESHEKGGIATPHMGLTLLRTGDSVPWQFTGRVTGQTNHSHTLEFKQTICQGVNTGR